MKCILLILTSLTSPNLMAQNNNSIDKIEFQSVSRGYYQKITITPDSTVMTTKVSRISDQIVTKNAISSIQWKSLIADLCLKKLAEISTYQSLTKLRTFDGARHSMITVQIGDQRYQHLFDNTDPHQKLQPLMKNIEKISKKE